jgi:hypothetical protein
VAVAIFSASVGVFALGVASVINQALNPSEWTPVLGVTPVDQLQGGRKMVLMWSSFAQMTGLFFVMIMAWVILWVILWEAYRMRETVGRGLYIASAALFASGLVFSFPPVYGWLFPA